MGHKLAQGFAILALVVGGVVPASAQGGGASTTGAIQGRVTDAQGAVLPGVTVTVSSPAMIGTQTQATNENGLYRFPGVPPGVYTLTFELAGFNTLRREGIQVTLGFTASVNAELQVATIEETVTVTGESPVIDTAATRVQQNFRLEQLESIPNARDMWSLLAVTPGVVMSRIDVAGNRAGTQTGYTAYGFGGQVRVLVEGINTTEGTGAAGFYFDYGSFEEVFLGTAGQGAEMPHPGVQSQFLGKSGGNTFSGEYYLDWYNNDLQASNIPEDLIARGIRRGSNEMQGYYDTNVSAGGPIRRDRVWWHFSYRDQKNRVEQPNFLFDKTFDTRLWNPSGKVTWQLNQNNKFIGYYQWGQKIQPNRLPFATSVYRDEGPTLRQDSGSWVWKGEWNGTLSDRLYVEARFGDFGYYFPLLTNTDEQYFWRDTGTLDIVGGERRWQLDRDRLQLTGAATYFLDAGWASHTMKFGAEMLLEKSWEGFEQRVGGNIQHIYANGRSNQVIFGFPTAKKVGGLGLRDGLLNQDHLDHVNAFLSDSIVKGRVTLNLGVRFDRYRPWIPEQEQLAATVGPYSIPAVTFPETTFFYWNSVVPRIGVVYDLAGNGRSVLKFNYGLFRWNPGSGLADSANPNQASKTVTYAWNDANGDRRWQPGEEGALLSTALAGTITVDPDIKQPYTHEVDVFFEQQLTSTMGARVGFVYKSSDDLWQTYRPNRPIEAYSVPFPFTDIGPDGRSGTADDRVITLYGLPSAQAARFPLDNVIMNVPAFSRYRTVEAQLVRRSSGRWSAQIGGSFTWLHDFPESYPNTPNEPFDERRTRWDLKASGTYEAPWGFRLSPVLRHQAGPNFARLISVPSSAAAAFGLIYSGTIYAEPADARRQDHIWLIDLRTEKTVRVNDRTRVRLFLDLFNIANSHAAETISQTTGTGFLRPSAILAPRTARLGFRFQW